MKTLFLILLLSSAVGILYTKNGRIAMAISCDDMPETMWSVDNPAYLLMLKLSVVLAEGLGKKQTTNSHE